MTRYNFRVRKGLFAIFFLVFALSFSASGEVIVKITREPLISDEIEGLTVGGAFWLKQAQEATGHFRYEYVPFLDRYADDDNIVRQAGALYVLSEVLVRDTYDPLELKDTVIGALKFLEQNSMAGTFNGYSFRCILLNEKRCSLGATSLALVGALNLVRHDPDLLADYRQLIDDYLSFHLAMKKNGAGFRDAYYVSGAQSEQELSFSNGEALLALARYYQWKNDEKVKVVIDDSFNYFSDLYGPVPDFNFYLWGMAAVKTLYTMDSKQEYFDFVKAYSDWRLDGYVDKRASTRNQCAYIEGIVSAYSVLEGGLDAAAEERYREEIDFWLAKSSDLQVLPDDFMWTRIKGRWQKVLYLKNVERAAGGFLTGLEEPVQRIDFTQHCVSAYSQKLFDVDGDGL